MVHLQLVNGLRSRYIHLNRVRDVEKRSPGTTAGGLMRPKGQFYMQSSTKVIGNNSTARHKYMHANAPGIDKVEDGEIRRQFSLEVLCVFNHILVEVEGAADNGGHLLSNRFCHSGVGVAHCEQECKTKQYITHACSTCPQ